ncbi:MAG: hypothetical protein ACRENN_05990 [Candidatus Eiseniibacteriota bacterium]
MAYLIAASGRGDIVSLVAHTMNNATVMELAADPVIGPILAAWLAEAGLTVAEAQRVQPAYDYGVHNEDDPEISTSFAVSSAAVSSLNLVATAVNSSLATSNVPRSWLSLAGLGMGTAGVIIGGSNLSAGGPRRALATVDIAVGAAAIITSSWALIQSKGPKAATHRQNASMSVRPSAGWLAGGPTLGLAMRF